MKKIIPLNYLTINQIAAGEVIERPASVIKEMVENSIDAGAKNINIEIKSGGISEIVVTDDGSGIAEEDMETAFERHATSKITNAEDLNTIYTMGFRGEALASIAAIASVEMISKTPEETTGHRLLIKGGKIIEKTEIAAQNGTKITVQDLFYNTPVRYKFLKKDYTEAGFIEDIVTKIALVNKDIAIKLVSSGKVLLQTNGNGNTKDLIYNIFGKDIAEGIVETEFEYEGIKVTGVVGKASIAKSNRSGQMLFVNNRPIKDRNLNVAIDQAYREILPYGKYGFAILNIQIDPRLVNVNVHPAKTEVKFEEPEKVFSAVSRTVKAEISKMESLTSSVFTTNTTAMKSSIAVGSEKIAADLEKSEEAPKEEPKKELAEETQKEEKDLPPMFKSEEQDVEPTIMNDEAMEMLQEERKKEGGIAGFFKKIMKDSGKGEEESNPLMEVYNSRKNISDLTQPIDFSQASSQDSNQDQEEIQEEKIETNPEVYFSESTIVEEFPTAEEKKGEDKEKLENEIQNILDVTQPVEVSDQTEQIVNAEVSEQTEQKETTASVEPVTEPVVTNEEIIEKKIEIDGTTISSNTKVLDFDINEALKQKTQSIDSTKKITIDETRAIPSTKETIAQETQTIDTLENIEKKEKVQDQEQNQEEKPLETTVPSIEAVENITSKILEMKMQNLDSTQMIDTSKIREAAKTEEKITPEFANMYKETFGVDANEIRKEKENLEREREKINVSDEFVNAENISIAPEKDIKFHIIGVAFDSNVIMEFNNEMYIVDTDAAKERLIYENVKNNYYDDKHKDTQSLLLPDIVTATIRQMDIARENKELFRKAGFDFEEFGENTLKLTAVPSICEALNTKRLFTDILDEIGRVAVNEIEEKEKKFIITVASKVAENEKKILDEKEINLLIRQLLSLEEPFLAENGRPTAIKMKKSDIEKKFARRK